MPHTESVLKTMKEYHPPFPSCKTQHLRRRGNCCDLGGTREAIKFIEHFMDCESSIRARREAEDVNIPNTLLERVQSHIVESRLAETIVCPEGGSTERSGEQQ